MHSFYLKISQIANQSSILKVCLNGGPQNRSEHLPHAGSYSQSNEMNTHFLVGTERGGVTAAVPARTAVGTGLGQQWQAVCCLCKTPPDLAKIFDGFTWSFLSWTLKEALESHLIVLIKKQTIIVNKYFSLPRLEVFLPTLVLPSGQEFHSCYAGDDMDCSFAVQGIKLAISKDKSSL